MSPKGSEVTRSLNLPFKKVLLAYSGSEGSDRAAEVAKKLAEELYIITVVRIPEYVRGEEEERERAREYYRPIVEKAKRRFGAREALIVFGNPAEEIVRVAEEIGADLIVLGVETKNPLMRKLGGVGDKVVDHAHCSVLVVR